MKFVWWPFLIITMAASDVNYVTLGGGVFVTKGLSHDIQNKKQEQQNTHTENHNFGPKKKGQ